MMGKNIQKFHDYAKKGNIEGINEYRWKVPHVDVIDNYKWGFQLMKVADRGTALLKAALGGHIEVMQVLIKAGANVNATTDFKNILAIVASSRQCSLEVIKFLIANGARLTSEVLDYAAQTGNEPLIKKCLKAGIKATHGGRNTTLQKAAVNGHLNAMQLLITAGANVNGMRGESVLSRVVATRPPDEITISVIEFLIEKNAELPPDVLHYAAKHGLLKLINKCLEKKVPVDAIDEDRHTPLMIAAVNGQIEAMKILIEEGANVNGISEGEGVLKIVINSLSVDEIEAEPIKVLLMNDVDLTPEPHLFGGLTEALCDRLAKYREHLRADSEKSTPRPF